MPVATVRVDFGATSSTGAWAMHASMTAATLVRLEPDQETTLVPLVIPESQAYFWTKLWQIEEAAALDELEQGQGVRFDDPNDAVRWLLSTED
jgi:hypothetical protein